MAYLEEDSVLDETCFMEVKHVSLERRGRGPRCEGQKAEVEDRDRVHH
jgi:hypothetical protein